jgi:hypothetical protein
MSTVRDKEREGTETSAMLIEAEGKILRLSIAPATRGQPSTARLQVFVEAERITLDEPEIKRLVTQLRRGSARKAV